MPSCPVIQVAVDGIIRALVHEQNSTAPISSGSRPACASAASAASREISSRPRAVYRRCSMPVFWLISAALIGDQL